MKTKESHIYAIYTIKQKNIQQVISTEKRNYTCHYCKRYPVSPQPPFFWYHAKLTEWNLANGHQLSIPPGWIYPRLFSGNVTWEARFLCAEAFGDAGKILFLQHFIWPFFHVFVMWRRQHNSRPRFQSLNDFKKSIHEHLIKGSILEKNNITISYCTSIFHSNKHWDDYA